MKTTNIVTMVCTAAILVATNSYAGEMTKEITLGSETSLLTAPVWIAENKGYFQQQDLNVTIKEFDSGKASFIAMLHNKEVDICTVAQTPIVLHSFDRNDFVIIAAMVYSDNDLKVLVRKDRGITGPSALKGKKAGLTNATTGQFFFDLYLTHHGVLSSDVATMDFKPSELPQAIADGRVDAIFTWEPHIINAAKLLGADGLILPSRGIYREDFYFVANRDFVKNNPQALKRFLQAIDKGQQYIKENKKKSIALVSRRLQADHELTASIWGDFSYQLLLDQTILSALEDEARWAIRNKLTDKQEVPNYLEFIHIDSLEQVRPEAVTIIR